MKKLIGNDWDEVLEPVFESEKYQELRNFLKEEYQTKHVANFDIPSMLQNL